MDIFVPNRKLWIPDSAILDPAISPIEMNRRVQYNRRICCLTPHRVMMGAAGGGVADDETAYALDGTGDFLSITDHPDTNVGSNDFTLEAVFRWNSTSGSQGLFGQKRGGSAEDGFYCYHNGSTLYFRWRATDGSRVEYTYTPGFSATTWYRLAFVRSGANFYIFEGGVDQSATEVVAIGSKSLKNCDGLFTIGRDANNFYFNGNIDEIRLSDVARWTSGFTPKTSQYVSDASTKLLIHCGETKTGTTGSGATFTDSGNTGHTVTENGNAIEDTVTYKF